MKNQRDYTGKTIFVGIDVHKKTYAISVVCDGALTKRDSLPADPKRLLRYLLKYFSGAKIYSAYEAGFSGFSLHHFLNENEVNNIVVNAASIEVGARDRVKTDKRDSLKIATQLSAGRLKGIFVPSPEMEDNRELTRYRATLVRDRNRIAARLKHKANYHGIIGPSDVLKVSQKWIDLQLKKKMMTGLRHVFVRLAKQWEALNQEIKDLDRLLKEQAVGDERLETVYRSVPGVGPTAARVLANELGDMLQFSSERALSSYTGLTPCEYSSGEHTRKGHISRQGKPILRCILVQCAWVAVRHDKGLQETFHRIASRAGVKRAIVAVARRLIGRIRACFRTNSAYKYDPVIPVLKVA